MTTLNMLGLTLLPRLVPALLLGDILALHGGNFSTHFLVVDCLALFFYDSTAFLLSSRGALLGGDILASFLGDLTANLFINLLALLLQHSLANVVVLGLALLIVNSLALLLLDGLTDVVVHSLAFSIVHSFRNSFLDQVAIHLGHSVALLLMLKTTFLPSNCVVLRDTHIIDYVIADIICDISALLLSDIVVHCRVLVLTFLVIHGLTFPLGLVLHMGHVNILTLHGGCRDTILLVLSRDVGAD